MNPQYTFGFGQQPQQQSNGTPTVFSFQFQTKPKEDEEMQPTCMCGMCDVNKKHDVPVEQLSLVEKRTQKKQEQENAKLNKQKKELEEEQQEKYALYDYLSRKLDEVKDAPILVQVEESKYKFLAKDSKRTFIKQLLGEDVKISETGGFSFGGASNATFIITLP